MEKIVFVSQKHGRKTRHGFCTLIGEVSFAVVADKAERAILFGIPGEDDDFIQAYVTEWSGKDADLDEAVRMGTERLEKSNPQEWVPDFSNRTLNEVRAKTLTCHKEYAVALFCEYRAFNGKEWS